MATIVPYALTSLTRVKARLGITVSGFDVMLSEMISGATDFIENFCDRRFLQTSYTNEIYDGSNPDGSYKKVLILKNAPLTAAPSSFQYRTGAKSTPTWVDFQVDTYQEHLNNGFIRVMLPPGYQNIRISYIAGYLINFADEYNRASHTLPFEVADLCDRLVTKLFKRRESEGKKNESFNQSAITWDTFLEDRDDTILANYSALNYFS